MIDINKKEEITYTLYATHDDINWFQLGIRKKEYNTPNILFNSIASGNPGYSKTALKSSFKNLKLIKLTKTILAEELDINTYL